MIIVKVSYTVKKDFVQQNKANIDRFIADFKKMNNNDFQYTAYLCGDGQSFVHLSHYQNEEIQKQLLETPSFLAFQKQRDESGLETTPQIEVMNLVASAHGIF